MAFQPHKSKNCQFFSAIGGALLLLLVLPEGARAQNPPSWSDISYSAMGHGSVACSHAGNQGDIFCFGLRCSASDNAPEWFTYQVGGDSVDGDVRVNLIVDGRDHSTLLMTQQDTAHGEWSFAAPYDPLRHDPIVDRLKAGSSVYVLVGGVAGAALSLRGSARELDRALALCESNIAVEAPAASAGAAISLDPLAFQPDATGLELTIEQLPRPVREEIEQIAAMCGNAFQIEGRHRQAIMATDIDGDGTYDFLLEHALFCPSEILMMCGASNCPHTLFVSANDTWRRFDFILQGYKEFSEEGLLFMCSTDSRKAGVFMENGVLTQRHC